MGYRLLDRGELEKALGAFVEAEGLAPGSTDGAVARADAFAEFELWDRASAEVELAQAHGYPVAERARSPAELYHQAIVDFVARRYARADAFLCQAVAQEPELYRAYFLLFRLRFRQGRLPEAKQALEECRRNLKEVNPRHGVVVSFLQRLDGRYEEAVDTLCVLRAELGSEVPSWMRRRLGEAHLVAYLLGGRAPAQLESARDELQQAVELEPGDGNSWSNLGNAQWLAGAREEARRSGERALGCDPDLPEAHRLLAALDAEARDWESAQRHIQRARDASIAVRELALLEAEFEYQRGRELYFGQRLTECIPALESCLASDPEHLAARCLLAQAASLLRNGELGLAEARRALELQAAWHPRFETGLLEGEKDGLAFQRRNLIDVYICLVTSAGALGRTLSEEERLAVRDSLAWLREQTAGAALDPASALNLAEAVATAPGDLRDCDWAFRLLDDPGMRSRYEEDPAGAETLRRIEEACQ